MNFTGQNFDNQLIKPNIEAVTFRAMLGDGILSGCAMSVSGTTLTIQSGALIATGRVFALEAAGAVSMPQTANFARVIAEIDLTKSATDSSFAQCYTVVQYASTADGFPALVQEDINGNGSQYQMVIAVVQLGSNPGIVSTCGNSPLRPSGGIVLTEGVDYGAAEPTTGLVPGRLFFVTEG